MFEYISSLDITQKQTRKCKHIQWKQREIWLKNAHRCILLDYAKDFLPWRKCILLLFFFTSFNTNEFMLFFEFFGSCLKFIGQFFPKKNCRNNLLFRSNWNLIIKWKFSYENSTWNEKSNMSFFVDLSFIQITFHWQWSANSWWEEHQ